MPVIGSNTIQETEYVGSYGLGNIFLGSNLVQGGAIPFSPFISASGGTITTSGNYKIHTFTSVGTSSFDILGLGSGTTNNTIDYLVVAGGGGGNLVHEQSGNKNQGIGGGAGGVQTGSLSATLGAKTIIVGAGGLGKVREGDQDAPGLNGNNSSALGITADFGFGATNGDDNTGGKSGNGYGRGTNNQLNSAPGGGGASEVGGNPHAPSVAGGDGGDGFASSISGVSTYYGGGGGGAPNAFGTGLGGLGGGGNSGGGGTGNGTANTGGGGGASNRGSADSIGAGNGGSGIVIVRYLYQ